MALTARDIVYASLRELGVYDPVQVPSAEDAALALDTLNQIVDLWNAERQTIFRSSFTQFTLTPGLSPHTVGPSGATFILADSRPTDIEAAQLLFNGTPTVGAPINIRDRFWWADQAVKGLTSNTPTDLYYDPTWPNGSIYFWPVPLIAYKVELMTSDQVATFALGDAFSFPQGYRRALVMTLAEELQGPFHRQLTPSQERAAAMARGKVFALNSGARKLETTGMGLPSGRGGAFNWMNRTIV